LLSRRGLVVPQQPARQPEEQWNAWRDEAIQQVLKIYRAPADYLELYRIAERLVEFDEYLILWRFHHIRMVERTIGMKQGTGGSEGVGYLMHTLAYKSFPELWQARTYLDTSSK